MGIVAAIRSVLADRSGATRAKDASRSDGFKGAQCNERALQDE
jgi:hypothetical protein